MSKKYGGLTKVFNVFILLKIYNYLENSKIFVSLS